MNRCRIVVSIITALLVSGSTVCTATTPTPLRTLVIDTAGRDPYVYRNLFFTHAVGRIFM